MKNQIDSNAPDLKEFMQSMGILSVVVVSPKEFPPIPTKVPAVKAPPSSL